MNVSNVQILAGLAWPSAWSVFGPMDKSDPVLDADVLNTIPKELRVARRAFQGIKVECADGRIDFAKLFGGHKEGMTAYAFAEVVAREDMELFVGAGADWWMQWWLDGKPIYDTLETGNEESPYSVQNHEFKIALAKGRHVLAVRVISGSSSFQLVSGVPDKLRAAKIITQDENPLPGCQLMPGAEFYVAVDSKGLWPNLTLMSNGDIVAMIYNHPSHGFGCGDIEAWVSRDNGRSWNFLSVVSDHSDKPGHVRMNHSVGLNARNELIALVSGYNEGRKPPLLPVQVCISDDGGCTWRRHALADDFVPYGNIVLLPDGRLASPFYHWRVKDRNEVLHEDSGVIISGDNGRAWGESYGIAERTSEVHVLRCRDGKLLAAARTDCVDSMDNMLPHGNGILLFASHDEGRTWGAGKRVSPPGQDNAHLLELRDGRLLLSLTSRIPGLFGVVLRMSADGGATWSVPRVLISMPAKNWQKTDCGYPSSVQLPDDTIVTAYYFGPRLPKWRVHTLPWHQRYHMGVARWSSSQI